MIGHMRHGSPPRLLALQSILSPNRRESLPTPSAGVRMTRPPDSAFGPCFAVSHSSWSHCFPPPAPPRDVPLCSPASQVLSASLTSLPRSSSATASGLPDAALELPPRAVTKRSRFPRKRCTYMQRV